MSTEPIAIPRQRTRGEIWEGVAFTFCRAATLVAAAQLLLGARYILPLIALCTALLYGVTLALGKRDTRCILRLPWLVILFWGAVGVFALLLILRGGELPSLVRP